MASVIITVKIMPTSPDTDLKKVQDGAEKLITDYGAQFGKAEVEPIAFGLSALNIIFIMDESKGATDPLEDQLVELDGVQSVEVTDVRRAIG